MPGTAPLIQLFRYMSIMMMCDLCGVCPALRIHDFLKGFLGDFSFNWHAARAASHPGMFWPVNIYIYYSNFVRIATWHS